MEKKKKGTTQNKGERRGTVEGSTLQEATTGAGRTSEKKGTRGFYQSEGRRNAIPLGVFRDKPPGQKGNDGKGETRNGGC